MEHGKTCRCQARDKVKVAPGTVGSPGANDRGMNLFLFSDLTIFRKAAIPKIHINFHQLHARMNSPFLLEDNKSTKLRSLMCYKASVTSSLSTLARPAACGSGLSSAESFPRVLSFHPLVAVLGWLLFLQVVVLPGTLNVALFVRVDEDVIS